MTPNLHSTMAYVDGKMYKVEPYPLDPYESIIDEPPTKLKRGVAYRYETDITKGLFPFRGEIDDTFNRDTSPVGIYYRHKSHGRYRIIILRPRTIQERQDYSITKERDLAAATLDGEYQAMQFADSRLADKDVGKGAYLPPIRPDDDFLNKLVKLAIRQKAAPLEPYGKRMAALAVDQRRSVEGNNIKNNALRRHRENSAMSPSKALQDSDAWQLELVVGVRNAPNAMHPIQGIPEDGVLLIYPNGQPFDLKKADLIDAEPLITTAIAETSEGIETDRQREMNEAEESED